MYYTSSDPVIYIVLYILIYKMNLVKHDKIDVLVSDSALFFFSFKSLCRLSLTHTHRLSFLWSISVFASFQLLYWQITLNISDWRTQTMSIQWGELLHIILSMFNLQIPQFYLFMTQFGKLWWFRYVGTLLTLGSNLE